MRFNLRRWSVFNLVGLGGFVLQLGAVAALTRGLGWSAMISTALALEIAATHNFFGHSVWTWSDGRPSGARDWLTQFGRFQAAKFTSLAASFIAASVFIRCGVAPELANTAAVLLCAIPNYLVAENYVYQSSVDRRQ